MRNVNIAVTLLTPRAAQKVHGALIGIRCADAVVIFLQTFKSGAVLKQNIS